MKRIKKQPKTETNGKIAITTAKRNEKCAQKDSEGAGSPPKHVRPKSGHVLTCRTHTRHFRPSTNTHKRSENAFYQSAKESKASVQLRLREVR